MVIKGVKQTHKRHSIADEFKHVKLKDYRLVKRIKDFAESMEESPQCSIPKACQDRSKTKACYRLLSNQKLNPNLVISSHRKETIKRIKEHDKVLIIQDTTSLDFTTHKKAKGLGPIGTFDNLSGIMVHSALCSTTSGVSLGLVAQKIWVRDFDERGKSSLRKKLPIEEKESYKWFEIMDLSLKGIPEGVMAITVADREADIFEFFHKAKLEKRELLIRAIHNRRVAQEQKRLYQQIEQSPIVGKCLVKLPRNTKLNTPERKALLTIKICEVTLLPPQNKNNQNLDKINLYAVYAEEVSPPKGVEPVKWLLLTTLPVKSIEQAQEKIQWYCHRWKIERFHFVLKSGYGIERLQLETYARLQNAISIFSVLAWKITWITYQSRETPNAPCTLILDDQEWKVLYCVVNKTSHPPKEPPTLKEAVILLARLGGFLARKNDGDPGVKTLWLGYRELNNSLKTLSALKLSPFS